MEERLTKLEKSNRSNKTLLVVILLLLLAIVAAGIGAALYLKSMVGELMPIIDQVSSIDFNKLERSIDAADRISKVDWEGLESAIENFKQTGEILGEFNEKISSISSIFGK